MVIVKDDEGNDVPLDESGFVPPPVGDFFQAAIKRRGLTIDEVSSKTGLSADDLSKLIDGRLRFEGRILNKLQALFPGTKAAFNRMQRQTDFVKTYGVMRPQSPARRASIIRRSRLKRQPSG